MKFAVLSDIHSNFEALCRVREDIEERSVDRVVCLGDLVGYGADPVACIDMIREMTLHIIMGNHDLASTGEMDISFFNPVAKAAVHWTNRQIKPKHIRFLGALRYTATMENMLFVHATPTTPRNWDYLFTLYQAQREFKFLQERICFIGHSHQPIIFQQNETGIDALTEDIVELVPDKRFIINVGSVGQPRDGDNRACYCILDTETNMMEMIRVAYDIEAAQAKILAASLPEILAERLTHGH